MSGEGKDEDDFLSRWSRRKRAAETEGGEGPERQRAAPDAPPVPHAGEATTPEAPPEALTEPMTEAELSALPRIEDLAEGSDIRLFLNPRVPAALRNAALRRIWSVTPAIRDHRDPAVDYAWDWNTPGGVPGDGHAPSPERAAEMLRELFRTDRPEAAAPPTAESPELVPDSGSRAAQDTATDTAPGTAPDTATALISDAGEAHEISRKTEDSSAPEPSPPRRRHGGAVPG